MHIYNECEKKEIADIKWMKKDVCGVPHSINNKDARPNWKVHAFKAKR